MANPYTDETNPDYNQQVQQQIAQQLSPWNAGQLSAASQVIDYAKQKGIDLTPDQALYQHLSGGRYIAPKNISAAFQGIDAMAASKPKETPAASPEAPAAFSPGQYQSQSLGSWNPSKLGNDQDIKYQVGRAVGQFDPNQDSTAGLVQALAGTGITAGPTWDTITLPTGEVVDVIAGEPGNRKWWWGQESEQAGNPDAQTRGSDVSGNRGTTAPQSLPYGTDTNSLIQAIIKQLIEGGQVRDATVGQLNG